jgi:glucose-6-phosphate isomerase
MTTSTWKRFASHLCTIQSLNMSLDISRMNFPDGFIAELEPRTRQALQQMAALEAGSIANPDEGRMVGHYWLRTPKLAPDASIRHEIERMNADVARFAAAVRSGSIRPQMAERFSRLLVIGIGGSALGPQLLADALRATDDVITPFFMDNTDPDGMDRIFRQLGSKTSETLILVISKSGGTKETRNGLVETQEFWNTNGLSFPHHAVAITGTGSALDRQALEEGWLARFPMWDWVGGRTSITSAVGLLPAALMGINCAELLAGAAACDAATRETDITVNPAMLLALMWHHATAGKGNRDMVVLPYKDRLVLFSRYLQQLIMESLGKERALDGTIVHQGLTVYGNKGSTDQHAYVQQLRDGINNFFVTFIRVLRGRDGNSPSVEAGRTSGDYLHGFLLGTRQALSDNGRESITITLDHLTPRSLGALVALYERAVGFYALMVGINAYHQPGVEAGKVAAERVLELQSAITECLARVNDWQTTEEIARHLEMRGDEEKIFLLLEHLRMNPPTGGIIESSSDGIKSRRYRLI